MTDRDALIEKADPIFRAAWHHADERGEVGGRVAAGLRALADAGWLREAGAREALRELHKPFVIDHDYPGDKYCLECVDQENESDDLTYAPWPCSTARLIYTDKELNR